MTVAASSPHGPGAVLLVAVLTISLVMLEQRHPNAAQTHNSRIILLKDRLSGNGAVTSLPLLDAATAAPQLHSDGESVPAKDGRSGGPRTRAPEQADGEGSDEAASINNTAETGASQANKHPPVPQPPETIEERVAAYDRELTKIVPPPPSMTTWVHNAHVQLALCIVEPRRTERLRAVLHNAAHAHGGRNVSLIIHHSTENADFVAEIVAGWTGVQLVNLGVVASMTISDYNLHLTNASFYRSLNADYVLIFQTDTLTRKPISAEYLNQSTGYDYVGAPWPPYFAPSPNIRVGNGGFSLRRVAAMIDICERGNGPEGQLPEDVWFAMQLDRSVPQYTVEQAMRFSVEAIKYDDPIGFHKVWLFQDDWNCVLHLIRTAAGYVPNKGSDDSEVKESHSASAAPIVNNLCFSTRF